MVGVVVDGRWQHPARQLTSCVFIVVAMLGGVEAGKTYDIGLE
jgi:hypothetical protein